MNITVQDAFARWSEAAGPWARWVKPSIFAPPYWINGYEDEAHPAVGWLPRAGETALVLDLPGPGLVRLGSALNEVGYCPVPLLNTTPGDQELFPARPLVDVLLTESLRLEKRSEGPPAFLLDVRRGVEGRSPQPGQYDNRWHVFGSDFPTEQALRAAGIRKLLVVTEGLRPDLHDALAHHTGLDLELQNPATEVRTPFPKPRWLALRMVSSLTHHTAMNDGSFGHIVPTPSSSGG